MAAAITGRSKELTTVGVFLDGVPDGGRALVIEGEPGVGKTSIWLAAVGSARDRGYRVLSARPGGSECSWLDGIGPALVDDLPPPQRRALRVALLLEEAGDAPVDQRLIAVALLTVLREVATASPIVLAIDDVQWLDSVSAAALEFAARRITTEPIGLLMTVRAGETALQQERAERVASRG